MPIIILGNKSDVLDKINDEKQIDFISHELRQIAVESQNFLITASAHSNRNIEGMLNLFLYLLLGESKTDMEVLK